MDNEYPLYPELTEQGEKEAQQIMDAFKPKILALCEEVLGDLYTDVSMHVSSDHWCNYRNQMMDGFRGYKTGHHEHDFKELRQSIYRNHKDDIVKDLNQDLVEEVEQLKEEIKRLQEMYRNRQ